MSYQTIDMLTQDAVFGGRVRACSVEQANTFKNDQRPDFVATANACLTGDGNIYNAFTRFTASAPGVGEKADDGKGGVEQANVTDGDILSAVQASWPVVSPLYFDSSGQPIGG